MATAACEPGERGDCECGRPWLCGANSRQVISAPAVRGDGRVVYFGSLHFSLYAVDTADGTKKRPFATEGAVSGRRPRPYNCMGP